MPHAFSDLVLQAKKIIPRSKNRLKSRWQCACAEAFSNWRDLFLFSGRNRVLPDLQVVGHYRATQDGRRLKLVANKPFKVFSGLQLQSPFFQSPKVNFLCCRGSQMPIKWCKMFYRSFKTNFCITFLLQLYRGKTFSCKQNMQTNIMVEPWLDLGSSVVNW